VLYGMCCVAAWELRRRDVRAGGTPFRVPMPTVVIVLALLAIAWMLTSVTPREWLAFAVAMGAGVLMFVLRRSSPRS
jgi:hypothetical protein